jgi:hypothetical protein
MDNKISLNKINFSKTQYERVIDTTFTQLVQPAPQETVVPTTVSVSEFFQNYQALFFSIPKFGNVNSHEYIIKTSQEYAGNFNNNEDIIQALIEEINQLRQENLEIRQQLLNTEIPTQNI